MFKDIVVKDLNSIILSQNTDLQVSVFDTDIVYAASSSRINELSGCAHPKYGLKGKTIADYNCDLKEFAHLWKMQCIDVIENKKKVTHLSTLQYNKNTIINFLYQTDFIYNIDHEIIGLYVPAIEIDNHSNIMKASEKMNELVDTSIKIRGKSLEKNYPHLNSLQSKILFHYLLGNNFKQLSEIFKLSTYRIYREFSKIQNTYNCQNITHLFDKMQALNFVHILPILS